QPPAPTPAKTETPVQPVPPPKVEPPPKPAEKTSPTAPQPPAPLPPQAKPGPQPPPSPPNAQAEYAKQMQAAAAFEKEQNYGEAIRAYKQALQFLPKDPKA